MSHQFALPAFCAFLAWTVFPAYAQPEYPGPQPGRFTVTCSNRQVAISNGALSAVWQTGPSGFGSFCLQDLAGSRELVLTGELFQITLANGRRYLASAMLAQPPRVSRIETIPGAARRAARIPGQTVEIPLRSTDGHLNLTWRAVARDNANYLRQELEVTPNTDDCVIQEIALLDQPVPGAPTVGQVDGSPLVAGNFFFGCEDPHARNLAAAPLKTTGTYPDVKLSPGERVESHGTGGISGHQARVSCRLPRNALLPKGEGLTVSFVTGVAPAGQLRRAFLDYLENERAHPFRPFLHYNSWYDIAWDPFALNETNCLEAIRLWGERFIIPYGVVLDALVFDDGWDDPKTLWQFHSGFPHGFTPLADLCKQYHTRLGVWLSPFGGYGEPRAQRLKFGREQGYEINAAGFSMAGSKYYAAFKRACAGMIRDYRVNYFKFDGIAAGMHASGGAQYILDTEAMRRLMLELRREEPNLYINLTTGSWPSPFWLRYADSVWRQGGDMGLAGKGPRQQQWLTYRDQETFRNVVRKGPLYPLNSLMTQGVAYSRKGTAGDPTFNSAGFKDDVHAFFGSGTGLQELYIQPGKLTSEDWKILAEAAKWSRANSDVFVDTHWIGGDPSKGEVYGYASWSPRKGILMLRNPDDRPQEYLLDLATSFELPPGSPIRYRLRSPWAEDSDKPSLTAQAGRPLRIRLPPFGIVVFDALPD